MLVLSANPNKLALSQPLWAEGDFLLVSKQQGRPSHSAHESRGRVHGHGPNWS